jgi:hypothetical protein
MVIAPLEATVVLAGLRFGFAEAPAPATMNTGVK